MLGSVEGPTGPITFGAPLANLPGWSRSSAGSLPRESVLIATANQLDHLSVKGFILQLDHPSQPNGWLVSFFKSLSLAALDLNEEPHRICLPGGLCWEHRVCPDSVSRPQAEERTCQGLQP